MTELLEPRTAEARPRFADAVILIVDDEASNVRALRRILDHAGYENVHATTRPAEVAGWYQQQSPDLVLLDLHMPEIDGVALLGQLRALSAPQTYLPVLMVTADRSPEARRHALSAGAKDFVTKPFDRTEVLLRIQNLLETRFLYLQVDRPTVAEGQAT